MLDWSSTPSGRPCPGVPDHCRLRLHICDATIESDLGTSAATGPRLRPQPPAPTNPSRGHPALLARRPPPHAWLPLLLPRVAHLLEHRTCSFRRRPPPRGPL